ncbi:hypothetical protein [Neobacillus drentensis]|uniref:hypothetical protein n=1 Tax=Neobacillus drentensis TaxID=220684 RepID=UPI002FFEC71C
MILLLDSKYINGFLIIELFLNDGRFARNDPLRAKRLNGRLKMITVFRQSLDYNWEQFLLNPLLLL